MRIYPKCRDGLGAGLVYADALVDKKVIDQDIMQPLMHLARLSKPHHPLTKGNTFKYVEEHLLTIGEITITSQIDTILAGILYGDTALFIDGSPSAILANTKGWSMRAPSEPNVEAVVRGPREGFTETLIVNLGLIRRRLKDPDLAVEIMEIGQRSKTSISLLYVADIASPELVGKLRRRLENISIDGIVDSGYIEQLIEDSTISFPRSSAPSDRQGGGQPLGRTGSYPGGRHPCPYCSGGMGSILPFPGRLL